MIDKGNFVILEIISRITGENIEVKRKILILGISGLTGYKLAKSMSSSYSTYGTFNTRSVEINNCQAVKLDVTNDAQLHKIFSEIKPDVVINTTALHNVDYCEDNREQSSMVNTKAILSIYQNSERIGSNLIHLSTDYVFNGNKKFPYGESDQTNPISIYGKSKLEGEKVLENSRHVVIRPSVIYGWSPMELANTTSSSGKPMNFALWVLTKLSKKESLRIVTDQYASATLADSLAESILKIAETSKSGLYHISGLSCESRYDFTIKLAEKFGHDPSLILPTTSASFRQKAKRPSYSCLNCEKAIKDFGLKLLTTDESLDIMKKQVEKEAPHLLGRK